MGRGECMSLDDGHGIWIGVSFHSELWRVGIYKGSYKRMARSQRKNEKKKYRQDR